MFNHKRFCEDFYGLQKSFDIEVLEVLEDFWLILSFYCQLGEHQELYNRKSEYARQQLSRLSHTIRIRSLLTQTHYGARIT